jgi:uncharacterized damage-inducible protein DinB
VPAEPPQPESSAAPAPDLRSEFLDAWAVNNRINLLLIAHTSDAGMSATLSKRGGRDVSRQLAHMHMVRVAWLENARGKDLAAGLPRFASKQQPSRAELTAAFVASGDAVGRYLDDLTNGRRESAVHKRGVGMFFSYLIAHEAHHRGSILLTLKQCGHKLDESLRWGIWAWDKI